MDAATSQFIRQRAGNRCKYCRLPSLLFNPRKDIWDEHFLFEGANIRGKTAIGRTTAWLLDMNSTERLRLRIMLQRLGLL